MALSSQNPLLHKFDAHIARKEFPILSQMINGKPLVYLDSAASAQKPISVINRMCEFMETDYANVHRGVYTLANRATEAFEDARTTVQQFINAPANTVVFTRSATEAINLVASSFVSPEINSGDEIVLSIMEHHSNIVPWHFLRERQGAVLKWVDVTNDGALDLEAFEKSLSAKTKLVCITHISNVLGTVNPLQKIISLAHARGIPVLVDGSQGIVHEGVDVTALDADFYIFTGHKLYGPTGVGVLYAKTEHLSRMRPYQGGGEMIEVVAQDRVTYAEAPQKFEAGTPPIVEAVGLGAAIKFLKQFDRDTIYEHELSLISYAHQKLSEIKGLRFLGTTQNKASILSFSFDKIHAHDIATLIDQEGVAVRAGTHCAQPLLQRFGLTSTCRASFALYNTREEIDALAIALQKAQRIFA